jgi:hypothetical protein
VRPLDVPVDLFPQLRVLEELVPHARLVAVQGVVALHRLPAQLTPQRRVAVRIVRIPGLFALEGTMRIGLNAAPNLAAFKLTAGAGPPWGGLNICIASTQVFPPRKTFSIPFRGWWPSTNRCRSFASKKGVQTRHSKEREEQRSF